MMRGLSHARGESGQGQILGAMAIGTTLLSAALFALQHSQQTAKLQIKGSDRGEMRLALDSAVRHAAQIFRNDAGCDPIILNERLARIELDGSIRPLPVATALPTPSSRPDFPPTGTYAADLQ